MLGKIKSWWGLRYQDLGYAEQGKKMAEEVSRWRKELDELELAAYVQRCKEVDERNRSPVGHDQRDWV